MSSPSTALGALEMSVIVSIFLLGVVTVQTLDYFSRFPNDRLSLKLLIITLCSRKDKSKSTQRLIRRLMFWTFVNGLVFCVAGIVAGILSYGLVQSPSVNNLVFSITFLSSLNARKSMRNLATSNEDQNGKPFSGLVFARSDPEGEVNRTCAG
ncbi:hypothetical protein ONZ45_g5578 [Pleurotus djamor]|nr:hypothetical protein ONZ45_g5578 [Pleurotus djamor]